MVNLNNGGNVIMANADFVPNVEMPNAPILVRPNTARQLRARAEFHAQMANLEAKIKAATERVSKNAANKAAKKAEVKVAKDAKDAAEKRKKALVAKLQK